MGWHREFEPVTQMYSGPASPYWASKAFLGGVINYLLTHDKIQHEYVKAYTDATFIVREDFGFNDPVYVQYVRMMEQTIKVRR